MPCADADVGVEDFAAAIFDLDGVVTRTARVHAASWKRLFDEYLAQRAAKTGESLRPFDIERDYRRHVDGKPRYDGVESFLQARSITLPRGEPSDPPDRETVCGLGNRKNQYFHESLQQDGVEVFDSAVALIRQLRNRRIGTALVSSSRNARAVLEVAGLEELFDICLDGNDIARLGLKGKPAPDLFVKAAELLGVDPDRAMVVEDAVSGVQAGRAGGFGLVVGIGRADQAAELEASGADIVVADLADLHLRGRPHAVLRAGAVVPQALEQYAQIERELNGRRAVVFLDYDGTLTPIVERPDLAVLSEDMRATVKALAGLCTVAIVSGRDRADVERLVGLDELIYAGSHGFDIAGPAGLEVKHEAGGAFAAVVQRAAERLREALAPIEGALVEPKRFAVAVHYRQVAEGEVARVEAAVDQLLTETPDLRKTLGKKVIELRPRLDWDKGKAVAWLQEALGLHGADVLPFYLGDDTTDEDAFAALAECGIGILVGSPAHETAARYRLDEPADVQQFLHKLAGTLEDKRHGYSGWTLAYEGFEPAQEGLREALCTLGNGYFATRGAAEEAEADGVHYPGTYLAGGYNRLESNVAGRVIENEDLVNLPNWLPLTFRPEGGDWLNLRRSEILAYRLELDLERGLLERRMRVRDAQGRETSLVSRRLVHMGLPHLAAIEVTLCAENWAGRIEVRSALDGRVINAGVERYRQLNSKHLTALESRALGDDTILLVVETNQSRLRIAEAARTRVLQGGDPLAVTRSACEEEGFVGQDLSFAATKGQPVTLEKVVALFTSRDRAISEPLDAAARAIGEAGSFDDLLGSHVQAWRALWDRCDLVIDGHARTQMILRLHIFHLLQTVSPHTVDCDAGVPARGLHGEAYRGHIFWDELFIFPFLNFHLPEITRALLLYRYRRLPEARRLARDAACRGAMYPWQSGSSGREESQVLHLNPRSGRWTPDNTHLQRHVSAAVGYNVWRYWQATGDREFLSCYGVEMLVEIARFWASIASCNEELGRYEIRGVMGPDEFHDRYPWREEPGLDNNAYTSLMAAWLLRRAAEALDYLGGERRRELDVLLGLQAEEIAHWQNISRRMRVDFLDGGIIAQFEGYDRLEELDWDAYRKKYGDIHRLDRILEAEGDTVNRYKVSKQADVLMLLYLFSYEELRELMTSLGYSFAPDVVRKTIDYYVPRTSDGSTLSRVVHSWVEARSNRTRSWSLLAEVLESDIADVQGGTTAEGIHLGAMAGTVDIVQRGQSALEFRDGALWINPCLPTELQGLHLKLLYRGYWLYLDISCDKLTVSAPHGWAGPGRIGVHNQVRPFQAGDVLEFGCHLAEDGWRPGSRAPTCQDRGDAES